MTDLCMSQPADRSVLSPVLEGSAALCTLPGWSRVKLCTQGQDVSQQRDDAGPAQQHLLLSGGPG